MCLCFQNCSKVGMMPISFQQVGVVHSEASELPLVAEELTSVVAGPVIFRIGNFIDAKWKETLDMDANGLVIRKEVRQVGGLAGSAVPYSTVCSYIMTGKIIAVKEYTTQERQSRRGFATHSVKINFTNIFLTNELESTTKANPYCQVFLSEMKNRAIAVGYLEYSIHKPDILFYIQTVHV